MYGDIVCNGTAESPSILTSMDDDLYGEQIEQSSGNPTYMAAQAMWVYYVADDTTINGMKIRWAHTGIQYDVNPGVTVTHTLQNCLFQQCVTGVYANLGDATLSLASDSKCAVTTPIGCPGYPSSPCDSISGSMTEDCGGDSDSDGLADSWEMQYFNTLAYNGADDPDGDGINNQQENRSGTNPTSATPLPEPDFTSEPLYDAEPREVVENFYGEYVAPNDISRGGA